MSVPALASFELEPSELIVVNNRPTAETLHVFPGAGGWLIPLRLTVTTPPAAGLSGVTVQLSDAGGGRGDFTSLNNGSVYATWPQGDVNVKPGKTPYATPLQSDFVVRCGQAQEWIPVEYRLSPASVIVRPELKPYGPENAISGVTFELCRPGQDVPLRQVTRGSQACVFSDLPPGPVTVRIIPPTQYGGTPVVLIGGKTEKSVSLYAGDDQDLSRYFRFRYETGALRGRVVDDAGQPVSGVTVVAQSNGQATTTRTDKRGKYTLRKLKVGEWTVMLDQSAVRFNDRTLTADPAQSAVNVTVQAGRTAKAGDRFTRAG